MLKEINSFYSHGIIVTQVRIAVIRNEMEEKFSEGKPGIFSHFS